LCSDPLKEADSIRSVLEEGGRDYRSGRLGIYSDDVCWLEETSSGRRISTDQAFLLFACAVGERFDRCVLQGRTDHADESAEYVLPSGTQLVELPHYESLRRPREVLRATAGTVIRLWRGLLHVVGVWVLGPNPFGVVLIALALVRRRRVALGVRQDTIAYYRSRLPNRRWTPALVVVWGMDRLYRLLARRLPTTVVGTGLARSYGETRPSVLPITVTLVRMHDVAREPPVRDWMGQIELLTVGRIDTEKNPLLLVEALARLEQEQPGRYLLRWVGRGPLEQAVSRRARTLGVEERIELQGYVPFGPALLDLYRRAHVFVHVSLTEGVPQVLVEALACGTPVVATDVGGVSAALDRGDAGLLVPPGNVELLVEAIGRLVENSELRSRLVVRGLELARGMTLEAEADRVARFVGGDG
jgi:glycosyltransferase involved in cell wall biosynthesis